MALLNEFAGGYSPKTGGYVSCGDASSFKWFSRERETDRQTDGQTIDIVSSQLYVCRILVSKKCQLQAGTIHP